MPISLGTTTVTALFLGTTSITSAYLGATQVFGGSFTPLSLFSSGAQGIWLDPSDLSTMFSDRAGTTPVTTPGTVVGLRLDKSKGLVLGSELVSNPGGPFVNTTGWLAYGTGSNFSVSGGNLVAVDDCYFPVTGLTVGKTYQVNYSVVSGAGIDIYPTNNATGTAFVIQKSGNGSARVTAVNTAISIYVNAGTTLASVSVRELAGNHAVAPTDAARPIYGIEPKGGRRNLLTWSEGFDNAVWGKSGASVSGNVITATATVALIYQSVTITPAATHTFSVKLKAGSAPFAAIRALGFSTNGGAWFNLSSGSVGTVDAGLTAFISPIDANGYYRCEIRFSSTPDVAGELYIYPTTANASYNVTVGGTIEAKEAQLELGSTASNYQKVTTAYDITESGVATVHYCQYDGSDDSMSTAAIDFTATDKMSVFAGVRKLSDAAYNAILETSADPAANNGTIAIGASALVGGDRQNWAYQARGTANNFGVARIFAAPSSIVQTLLVDISQSTKETEIIGRLDGVQQSLTFSTSAIIGTGNFGNHPMFIGRRNNATAPFNGRDYGLIVVGKAASAGEITDTETWLAARTSGVSI